MQRFKDIFSKFNKVKPKINKVKPKKPPFKKTNSQPDMLKKNKNPSDSSDSVSYNSNQLTRPHSFSYNNNKQDSYFSGHPLLEAVNSNLMQKNPLYFDDSLLTRVKSEDENNNDGSWHILLPIILLLITSFENDKKKKATKQQEAEQRRKEEDASFLAEFKEQHGNLSEKDQVEVITELAGSNKDYERKMAIYLFIDLFRQTKNESIKTTIFETMLSMMTKDSNPYLRKVAGIELLESFDKMISEEKKEIIDHVIALLTEDTDFSKPVYSDDDITNIHIINHLLSDGFLNKLSETETKGLLKTLFLSVLFHKENKLIDNAIDSDQGYKKIALYVYDTLTARLANNKDLKAPLTAIIDEIDQKVLMILEDRKENSNHDAAFVLLYSSLAYNLQCNPTTKKTKLLLEQAISLSFRDEKNKFPYITTLLDHISINNLNLLKDTLAPFIIEDKEKKFDKYLNSLFENKKNNIIKFYTSNYKQLDFENMNFLESLLTKLKHNPNALKLIVNLSSNRNKEQLEKIKALYKEEKDVVTKLNLAITMISKDDLTEETMKDIYSFLKEELNNTQTSSEFSSYHLSLLAEALLKSKSTEKEPLLTILANNEVSRRIFYRLLSTGNNDGYAFLSEKLAKYDGDIQWRILESLYKAEMDPIKDDPIYHSSVVQTKKIGSSGITSHLHNVSIKKTEVILISLLEGDNPDLARTAYNFAEKHYKKTYSEKLKKAMQHHLKNYYETKANKQDDSDWLKAMYSAKNKLKAAKTPKEKLLANYEALEIIQLSVKRKIYQPQYQKTINNCLENIKKMVEKKPSSILFSDDNTLIQLLNTLKSMLSEKRNNVEEKIIPYFSTVYVKGFSYAPMSVNQLNRKATFMGALHRDFDLEKEIAWLAENHGFIFMPGGDDVLDEETGEETLRTKHEVEIVKLAQKYGVPIIGTCRGAQLPLYHYMEKQAPNNINAEHTGKYMQIVSNEERQYIMSHIQGNCSQTTSELKLEVDTQDGEVQVQYKPTCCHEQGYLISSKESFERRFNEKNPGLKLDIITIGESNYTKNKEKVTEHHIESYKITDRKTGKLVVLSTQHHPESNGHNIKTTFFECFFSLLAKQEKSAGTKKNLQQNLWPAFMRRSLNLKEGTPVTPTSEQSSTPPASPPIIGF